MIETVNSLVGEITTRNELTGEINNAVIELPPITQEKEVIPNKELQIIVPDENYTGLSKVEVSAIPDEYIIPKIGTKTISANGIYNAIEDGLDGYSQVEVATNSIDLEDYMRESDLMLTLNTSPFYKPSERNYTIEEIQKTEELIRKLGGN